MHINSPHIFYGFFLETNSGFEFEIPDCGLDGIQNEGGRGKSFVTVVVDFEKKKEKPF